MKDIAQKVNIIAKDSLYRPEEVPPNPTKENLPKDAVIVVGIMSDFAFHPGRLEAHCQEVKEILLELNETFQKSKGGGWSFLNLCELKNGEQWTGLHADMEVLCVLAIGLKLGGWLAPKEMWDILPGKMPYIVFDVE